MNKTLVCIILILLVSCTSVPTETATPTEPPFVYSQECPHVCWLHINPGVTTMQEARRLLSTSKEVSFAIGGDDDSRITVHWRRKEMEGEDRKMSFYVDVLGKNGIVSEVIFEAFKYLTVEDFIDLLGEPDEIAVTKEEKNGVVSIEYYLYYIQEKVLIGTWSEDLTGPQLTDPLGVVHTNTDLNNDLPNWVAVELFQPWLGFGKVDQYLLHK